MCRLGRLQHTTCHIRKEVAAHHRASTLSPGRTKAAAPPCATAPQILPCRAGRLLPNMAGRLLGAIAAGAKAYLACEPSTATHAGLLRLAEDFAAPSGMHTQILKQGAEETSLPPASVDMAFTSPPYFNLEVGRLSCGHPNMAGSPVANLAETRARNYTRLGYALAADVECLGRRMGACMQGWPEALSPAILGSSIALSPYRPRPSRRSCPSPQCSAP